jgi:1-phosphofructokinase
VARVAVFGPNPLLTVVVERSGEGADEIHLHAGGQGVWVARMAAELGAVPLLCGFAGGETGAVLEPLLATEPGERRLVPTVGPSGCYVMDRRGGEREVVAIAPSPPPSRHELDDLVAVTMAAALECDLLVVCNSFPPEGIPLDAYCAIVTDVRANGTPVVVDLSSPRLDHALRGGPDLVKLNDWELAQYVDGPVDPPDRLGAAAQRLRAAGAASVVVTRGAEPALCLDGDDAWTITPPRFDHGMREGCGDAMTGAIAAALAGSDNLLEAVRLGAAAGAANFLRRGLGTGDRATVESLLERVQLERYPAG